MARLARFIRDNTEDILVAWEDFVRHLPGAAVIDGDHARAMLRAVARDLESSRTPPPRADESCVRSGSGTAFHVETTLVEFRALRASVIRVWRDREGHPDAAGLDELARFNEAIDEAVAESIGDYVRHVDTVRDRFLAVLGHDLRAPLGAILVSSEFLLDSRELTGGQRANIATMKRSGKRVRHLVKDLLHLAVTGLAEGIPTQGAEMDVGALMADLTAEILASNPVSHFAIESHGSLTGWWDRALLAELFTNLLANALEHGSHTGPIHITSRGDQAERVVVSISNFGATIPADRITRILRGMKRNSSARERRQLGLGLYMVEKIVEAHAGTIAIRSTEGEGTTFTVSLPRRPAASVH
jgi:signal transduction histidine kinase